MRESAGVIVIAAIAVGRVHPDAMVVVAEIVALVGQDRVGVGPMGRAGRVVMVRDRAAPDSVEEDLGAMNAAHCLNAVKPRILCRKLTPRSFLMKKAWSPWRVR